jgi:hypothetical protein
MVLTNMKDPIIVLLYLRENMRSHFPSNVSMRVKIEFIPSNVSMRVKIEFIVMFELFLAGQTCDKIFGNEIASKTSKVK